MKGENSYKHQNSFCISKNVDFCCNVFTWESLLTDSLLVPLLDSRGTAVLDVDVCLLIIKI